MSTDARTDWENRIGLRSGSTDDAAFGGSAPRLRPARRAGRRAGGSQVTLTGRRCAARSATRSTSPTPPAGPFEPLDHAGRDVLAVPHPPYVDTTGEPGEERWYAVSSLSDVHVEGPLSAPVVWQRRSRERRPGHGRGRHRP